MTDPVATAFEVTIQRTLKKPSDRLRDVAGVSRLAQKTRLLDDILPQRSHITGDHGHAKIERQERNPALKDIHVREYDNVGSLEVLLSLFVWNEFDPLDDPIA